MVLVACISIFFLTLFGFFIVEIRSNDSSDGDKGQATLKHQLVSQQLEIALMHKENSSGAEGQEKIRTALLKALEHADTEKDRELIRTRAAEYKINLGTAKP